MRYAIYFTPPADAPLSRAAARWLGRDAFSGEPVSAARTAGADHAHLTAAPRRYGFHATMKAPFALAPGESQEALAAALQQFCARQPAVAVPEMRMELFGYFFALVPARPSPPLDALAAAVTAEFDRFRAPMDAAELTRRSRGLTEAQRHHLQRWGYPYVFEQFRFHMTLTDRVPEAERPSVSTLLERHFGPLLSAPLGVDRLALFVEPEPEAPFHVHANFELAAP